MTLGDKMLPQKECSNTLYAAQRIADHATNKGIPKASAPSRPVYDHIGALLADSVLQAGLNYSNIVRPRVRKILQNFPQATTLNILVQVIEEHGSNNFLQWQHHEKISRFNELVDFLVVAKVESTTDLGEALLDETFRIEIQGIKGIGPKTVDYMACLVGMDCIAVDRHIRGFAEQAGLKDYSYDYLRDAFSLAADLLCISLREFDASIWRYQSNKKS